MDPATGISECSSKVDLSNGVESLQKLVPDPPKYDLGSSYRLMDSRTKLGESNDLAAQTLRLSTINCRYQLMIGHSKSFIAAFGCQKVKLDYAIPWSMQNEPCEYLVRGPSLTHENTVFELDEATRSRSKI